MFKNVVFVVFIGYCCAGDFSDLRHYPFYNLSHYPFNKLPLLPPPTTKTSWVVCMFDSLKIFFLIDENFPAELLKFEAPHCQT